MPDIKTIADKADMERDRRDRIMSRGGDIRGQEGQDNVSRWLKGKLMVLSKQSGRSATVGEACQKQDGQAQGQGNKDLLRKKMQNYKDILR